MPQPWAWTSAEVESSSTECGSFARRTDGNYGSLMTIRVGFLGAGTIATFHSKSLRVSSEPVAWSKVFDPDTERAHRFAAASGSAVASSEEEVIDASDAVYVCTWTSEHERLVSMAADAGKAIFCEKPLGTDLASARRIVADVQHAAVVNQVGLILRRSPVFHLLKQLSADPASGDPITVIFRDDQFFPIQGHYASTWRADVSKAGAGVLIEHSIHDVDLLEWMFGSITSVSASTRHLNDIEGIEDSVVAHFQFESGLHATLTSVWHDLLERPSNRHVEVFGATLWAELTGEWFGQVRWTQGSGSPDIRTLAGAGVSEAVDDPLAGENPDGAFIRAVRDGSPAYPAIADALRAHIVVDATYRSADAAGAVVEI